MNFIHESVKLGIGVKVGHFAIIEENVEVGEYSIIGNNVTVYKGSKIGRNTRIDDNTVIGKQPMKAVTSATSEDKFQPPCILGDDIIIGTSVVIYAGCTIGKKCLVADLSTIRENVSIGIKTIIGRGVAVENYCNIGSCCKLETNAYITAYSEVEDYVFIAPGVVTSNDNYAGRDIERFNHFKGVTIKKGGRIGAQATILPGKIINEDTFVAAGAVVTKDTEAEAIYIGNPAKKYSKVEQKQLLKNQ
jgi:acetyltransferase-like isoleucine patch superfamily enzyme